MTEYSFVSESAIVADDVKIGRFCVIEDEVAIGAGAIIEDFALLQRGAKIGRGTRIGTYTKVGKNAIIGEQCSFTSFCEIRDNCRVGNRVTMGSRGTLSAGTTVGDDVVMKYAFVVTDTPDLKRNHEKVVGRLGARSRFGANVVIMPGCTIGADAEIGACSQVRHDVPDGEIWYGNPAKFFRRGG